jgi:hypothetical protein
MNYFKVVRNDGGTLYSGWTPGPNRETYVPDVPLKPTLGKVFIFGTLAEAVAFMGTPQGDLEVWECQVEGVEQVEAVLPQNVVMDDRGISKETVIAFWDDKMWKSGDPARQRTVFASYKANGPISVALMRPPEGTFLADAVTLLRKVQ